MTAVVHFDSGFVYQDGKLAGSQPACWSRNDTNSPTCQLPSKPPKVTKDRRSETITCEACREIAERDAKCLGCDRPFRLDKDGKFIANEVYRVRLAPNVLRLVHGSRRTAYSGDFARKPMSACFEKAVAGARFCSGCGGDVSKRGELCGVCEHLLEAGKKHEAARAAEGNLKRYVIDESFFPLDGYHWEDRAARDRLREALAQACAGIGREWWPKQNGLRLGKLEPEKASAQVYETYGPCVELTPEQADALRSVLVSWKETFETVARVHRDDGRSVLLAMARGELTVDEINAAQAGSKKED